MGLGARVRVSSAAEMHQHWLGASAARRCHAQAKATVARPTVVYVPRQPTASASELAVGMMSSEPSEMPMSSIEVPHAYG